MKSVRKFTIIVLLIVCCRTAYSQDYFQGEVTFSFLLDKKDSSFDETSIASYPATLTNGIFMSGSWMQKPNAGSIEYYYFNAANNKFFWKFRDVDTVYCQSGINRRESEFAGPITPTVELSTDTILGYSCNKLSFEANGFKFAFLYSPELAIDPLSFVNTKMGYYDIIYGSTKAIYLASIVETNKFISKMIAIKVNRRKIEKHEFPDTKKYPIVEY